jgi:O-antigen/teichoic acid export membrane protein
MVSIPLILKSNTETIYNIVFKIFGTLFTFLVIPLGLKLLGNEDYGIWLTLSSFAAWFNYIDAGLGNGMRNKLAIALAQGNKSLAQEYVSTTYAIFILIMFTFFLFSIPIVYFINWSSLLGSSLSINLIIVVVLVMFATTCLRLVLDLANTVFLALEKSYMKLGSDFFISVVYFFVVYFFPQDITNRFLAFSIVFSLVPIIVLLVLNFFLFRRKSEYHFLQPQLGKIKKTHIGSLMNLSLNFFVIQLIGIIIFSTDNLLIITFFSPTDVTAYNVAFKYFSISTILFSIIMLPYWTAFTKAHENDDSIWIKNAFRRLYVLWSFQIMLVIIQILFSTYFYNLWIGDTIKVPLSTTISLGIYAVIFNWNNIFSYFLNGVSKLKLQLFSALFVGVINLPVTYILIKYSGLGPASIVIANVFCLLISSVWSPIQSYRILNKTATGIWNK